jgi:hypothetical protein
MEISKGAQAIIQEAQWAGRDREQIAVLIKEHGIPAAAEAIFLLGQVVPQAGNVGYDSRR